MADVLLRKFPDKFMSPALIEIGPGWLAVAQNAVIALSELHPDIRVGAMWRDIHGLLAIDVGIAPVSRDADVIEVIENIVAECDAELLDAMLEVIGRYRLLSAWTCYDDGRPGWLVDAREGRRPLCRDCQEKRGMRVVCHAA